MVFIEVVFSRWFSLVIFEVVLGGIFSRWFQPFQVVFFEVV